MVKQQRVRTTLLATPAVPIPHRLLAASGGDVTGTSNSNSNSNSNRNGGDVTDSIDGLTDMVLQLLAQLAVCESLDQQVKAIQLRKGAIKKKLVDDTDNSYSASAMTLLYVYVHPDLEALRKYMEWVVECLIRRLSTKPSEVLHVVSCVHDSLLQEFGSAAPTIHRHNNNSSQLPVEAPTNILAPWMTAFANIAMIDKEIPFLSDSAAASASAVSGASVSVRLLSFIELLSTVVQHCVRQLQSDSMKSPVELSQIGDCCGEALKGIVVALKSRRAAFISVNLYQAPSSSDGKCWGDVLNQLCANALQCLAISTAHKDMCTSAAMCAVCLQWLCRFVYVGNRKSSVSFHVQLVQFSALFCSTVPETLSVQKSNDSLLPALSSFRSGTSRHILANCAIVRALLSVFEDQILWACDESSSVDSGDMQHMPLLLTILFQEVLYTCQSNLPETRLYGLQTLETWFNSIIGRLSTMVSTSSFPTTYLAAIHTNLRAVSNLLCSVWAHPAKQISHVVPTVFTRLVESVNLLVSFQAREGSVGQDIWKPFIADVFSQPAQHRYYKTALMGARYCCHCYDAFVM
jgi:hypothetical protein